MKHHHHKHSRRTFIKAAAATAIALGGCGGGNRDEVQFHPTAAQLAMKKSGRSIVGIVACESYEEDLFKKLKEVLQQLQLPDLKNKVVVIKPNMVEYRPDRPVTTNAAMIAAAAQLADYLGAKEIIVGEGPGHFRDTQYLLDATGFGAICKKLGLRFVDLNYDDLEKVPNINGLSEAKNFFLPKTVMEADVLLSLPKLKTHHWVFMTASMKNLFGTVPGRKYGWPKNFLHINGINQSIIDLVHLIKPSIALVDAVVAMEGDGPINGRAKNSGFMVLGSDVAAVDGTCARAISMNPFESPYLRMADQVVGNVSADNIDIVGASLESVTSKFEMAPSFYNRKLLRNSGQAGS
jgi:uncharacterized protein (DUF362 family)